MIKRMTRTLPLAARMALLVGPLAAAVIVLHLATVYRGPVDFGYRTRLPALASPSE